MHNLKSFQNEVCTMIDNFKIIEPLLIFENEDDFYMIQLIKRRKDNPEMKNDISIVDRFYIDSLNEFSILESLIKRLCDERKARAYINLCCRNNKIIALQTLRLLAEDISLENYKKVRTAFHTACGKYSGKVKRWFVDLDSDKLNQESKILEFFQNKNISTICVPSKTGKHIVINPFDPRDFYKDFPGIDLNKDSPTNLYIPNFP